MARHIFRAIAFMEADHIQNLMAQDIADLLASTPALHLDDVSDSDAVPDASSVIERTLPAVAAGVPQSQIIAIDASGRAIPEPLSPQKDYCVVPTCQCTAKWQNRCGLCKQVYCSNHMSQEFALPSLGIVCARCNAYWHEDTDGFIRMRIMTDHSLSVRAHYHGGGC